MDVTAMRLRSWGYVFKQPVVVNPAYRFRTFIVFRYCDFVVRPNATRTAIRRKELAIFRIHPKSANFACWSRCRRNNNFINASAAENSQQAASIRIPLKIRTTIATIIVLIFLASSCRTPAHITVAAPD
jgi:hypothetical protein